MPQQLLRLIYSVLGILLLQFFFIKENTLLGQALITDPKKSVDSFLNEISKNNNISLNIASMDLYTI